VASIFDAAGKCTLPGARPPFGCGHPHCLSDGRCVVPDCPVPRPAGPTGAGDSPPHELRPFRLVSLGGKDALQVFARVADAVPAGAAVTLRLSSGAVRAALAECGPGAADAPKSAPAEAAPREEAGFCRGPGKLTLLAGEPLRLEYQPCRLTVTNTSDEQEIRHEFEAPSAGAVAEMVAAVGLVTRG
jgi:hypothetical protein